MNAMLPSLVSTLGWALIHFLWQGLLIGMAATIALLLMRNARPQTRYALCCAALALCLLLPALGVWRGLQADVPVAASPAPTLLHIVNADAPAIASPLRSWQPILQAQLPQIVALWSIGAALLALRMALGMLWVGRIGSARDSTGNPHWQARLDRLAITFGLTRAVRLRVANHLDGPIAADWWRPIVLVPAALVVRMPPDLLEALLAHELAHIKRHDYLINLLQSAIEALLFYHPVVWWLSRQIRIEREKIADDLAAAALGDPRRLALALQALDQFQLDPYPHPSQLAPAAHGGILMSRIQRLLRPDQHVLSWKIALPIIGLSAICLSVYAHNATLAATRATAAAPVIAATPAVATPAVSATPAVAATPVVASTTATSTTISTRGSLHISGQTRDAYAVIRAGQDGITMSGSTSDIPAIEQTKKSVSGDFVWVRRGQKTYVVQDPAILAKVAEAWRPVDAIDAQMEALDARMEGPNKQMEALSQQMEALEAKNRPYNDAMEKTSARMEALGRQEETLGAKMETLGNQMEGATMDKREAISKQMQTLQAQMALLSAEMEKLNAEMESHGKQMEATRQPMEQLSQEMEKASQPMEALGKQMDALGKQEDQASRAADETVNALIDEALRSGKAVPVSGAVR